MSTLFEQEQNGRVIRKYYFKSVTAQSRLAYCIQLTDPFETLPACMRISEGERLS